VSLEESVRALLEAGRADEAVTAVIREMGASIRGYLYALHGDDDGADVHATWEEAVWKGLAGFRFEGSLRSWVYSVAWVASARFYRDGWRRRRVRLATSAASHLAAPPKSGSTLRHEEAKLDELRRELAPADHTLLILRLDRELTYEEIGRVLSQGSRRVTPVALRKRYERLKANLAAEARRRGFIEPADGD
jgi:RNA polymerase sigma-70 factor, ECF subfamily